MASSLESNKIAAAVLTAGVVAMLSGFVANLIYHPQVELEENVYVVAAADGAGAAEAPAEEDTGPDPIAPLLAEADVAAGETLAARQCGACHTFTEGGPSRVGPNLYDIVNQQIAAEGGFSYSSALADMSGDTWTYEHLNAFLTNPRGFAPGTKMTFRGLSKTEDRANVVAYLRGLSNSPAPLPE
jgi:cytochrome c